MTLQTAAQVAATLGISARAVYELAASGRLTFYKFGRAVRFDPADIDAYIKATAKPKPPGLKRTPREIREWVRIWRRAGSTTDYGPTPEQIAIADTRYRRQRMTPWADGRAIRALYQEARRLSAETGIPHEVDHVIPLMGNFVSGLHVETNMRVIPKAINHKKRNQYEIE